jgi:tetratricopeptide (TPR) repeat protein
VRPEAYDAFLRGTHFLHQGLRGTENSIAWFQRAIELDPTLADAHAGLAEALCFAGIFGLRPSAEAYPEARQAALKALAQDESNASAHDALGEVKQGYDWDLAGAQAEFRRSLELDPSNLITRLRYAESLTRTRKFDQAVEETERTLAWDPVSPIRLVSRSMIFFRARRYDESIQASRQALEFDPTNVNALWWQGVSYAGKHEYAASIAALTKALSIADVPLMRGYLGFVYGKAGERGKAFGVLQELQALSKQKQRVVSPVDFALIYAGLGDADATFEWLEKAYRAHEGRFELASMYYDGFRSDPRYSDLARRVGMPL